MQAVVFSGIQASGKSSFFKEHFADSHVRINLDMLRTRHREAVLLRACLEARQAFVVDNTNLRAAERAGYIRQARGAGFSVVGYRFQVALTQALARNGHIEIKKPLLGSPRFQFRLYPPDQGHLGACPRRSD
ncbi:MAG: AAA family ATPase [Chromatiaceae bacterium]